MVDKKIVEYVANLARIEILQAEAQCISAQLSDILAYIDKLKELDVERIEPLRGTPVENNIFRKDEVFPSGCQENILKNAPACDGNYFKIPKVIE